MRDSLGAPADGREEEQSEIPLAGEPDDMPGKHRDGEQISLERAQFSERESKVVPKHAFPALKSPPADTKFDKSRELHAVMKQTAVNGFSRANCTRSTNQGEHFFFQADVRMDPETTTQVAARQFMKLPMAWQQ